MYLRHEPRERGHPSCTWHPVQSNTILPSCTWHPVQSNTILNAMYPTERMVSIPYSTHLAFSALKWFEKVRGGSLWLNHSETVPYTPCSHCVDEVREGSVQSNHSELTSKTSTHLANSALKWFEEVRGG